MDSFKPYYCGALFPAWIPRLPFQDPARDPQGSAESREKDTSKDACAEPPRLQEAVRGWGSTPSWEPMSRCRIGGNIGRSQHNAPSGYTSFGNPPVNNKWKEWKGKVRHNRATFLGCRKESRFQGTALLVRPLNDSQRPIGSQSASYGGGVERVSTPSEPGLTLGSLSDPGSGSRGDPSGSTCTTKRTWAHLLLHCRDLLSWARARDAKKRRRATQRPHSRSSDLINAPVHDSKA